MGLIPKYVDPDATGSESGDDWTNAYTSLNQWESANEDLTDEGGDYMEVHCKASSESADTTACVIDGWTTGVTNYILIVVDQADRHDGEWDATKYRIDLASGPALDNKVAYVRVDGLQIESSTYSGAVINICADASQDVRFSNMIISATDKGGIATNHANCVTTIWNCISYSNASSDGEGILNDLGTTMDIYNSVVYGFDGSGGDGIEKDTGAVVVVNCAVFSNADDFDAAGPGSLTVTYTASDDTESGTGNINSLTWTDVFESPSTYDFHLKSTDTDLTDAGTDDPSGLGYGNPDIMGETRTGTWDIGADENVSVGGRTTKNTDAAPLGNRHGMSWRLN